MTLVINTTIPQGHVLAADSRQTYNNKKGQARIGSESAMKVFKLSSRVGAATSGIAFLENKNIAQHIKELLATRDFESLSVEDVATAVYDYFFQKYGALMDAVIIERTKELTNAGHTNLVATKNANRVDIVSQDAAGKESKESRFVPPLEFLVAGFNADKQGAVFRLILPLPREGGGVNCARKHGEFGASWIGQTDVVVRIVKGWGLQVKNSPSIQALPPDHKAKVLEDLDKQEYVINWGTMTFQDAADFCVLAIRTTEAIQRFSDGTIADPGDFPGVGGDVDIALVTPEKGFVWAKRKVLRVGSAQLDLDAMENVDALKTE